jgi:hypothetical protein
MGKKKIKSTREKIEKQREAIDTMFLSNRMAVEEVDNAFKNVPEPKHIHGFYLLYPSSADSVPLLEEVQEYLQRLDEFNYGVKFKLEFLHYLKKDYHQRSVILKDIDVDKISLEDRFDDDFLSEFIQSINNWFTFWLSTFETKGELKLYENNRRPYFKEQLKQVINKLDTFAKLIDDEIKFYDNLNRTVTNNKVKQEILNIEPERILWRGTKQDLVTLYDTLIEFGFIFQTKNKDQLLGKHFSLIDNKNKISEVGELKHTRKQLKESYAKPTEKMEETLKTLKNSKVDNK